MCGRPARRDAVRCPLRDRNLQRRVSRSLRPARGYAIVVWRGRHVAEPTELTDDEAATFWLEVLAAARAIEARFRPAKLNYEALGNGVPHLHVHLVPRYLDDDAPGRPLSARHFDEPAWIAAGADLAHDVAALKRSIRPPTRSQGRVHQAT